MTVVSDQATSVFLTKMVTCILLTVSRTWIITGGENVYPREVEEVLYMRPEVEECAVVGFPDKEWGEKVTAFIVPRPGQIVVPNDVKTFQKQAVSF